MVEPWLRGTLTEIDAVRRQVLHALTLVGEDADRWCASLTDVEMNARPYDLTPVAFHLRHIARSLDRLLTYAEGAQLLALQRSALAAELTPGARTREVMEELHAAIASAKRRVMQTDPEGLEGGKTVGRQELPTTLAGLLIHCAEHSQRHSGQAITTAQIVTRMGARRDLLRP